MRWKHFTLVLPLLLLVALACASGCRRKRPVPEAQPEQPAIEEAKTPAPLPVASPSLPAQSAPVAASVDRFQTSTEFEDLTKDFQLYCNFKKRVPTDINEFFRDQKIKPPAIPPGTRLAIDPKERKIILVK